MEKGALPKGRFRNAGLSEARPLTKRSQSRCTYLVAVASVRGRHARTTNLGVPSACLRRASKAVPALENETSVEGRLGSAGAGVVRAPDRTASRQF